MNKHRNKDRRFSVVEMVLLGFAAPALMGGGFIHAWLKNSQVEVVKDIRKTEQRIGEHEGSINSLVQSTVCRSRSSRSLIFIRFAMT
jgi:hypothetical protein